MFTPGGAAYRDLWSKDLPRYMLYQLAIYAASAPDGRAAILYPTTAAGATEAKIDVRDPVGGRSIAQVSLRPVSLTEIEELALAPETAALARRRRENAEWMLTGTRQVERIA